MIVETEKQRKALQAAAESGKQEGVQGVWGFKYTIFTGHFKGEERKVSRRDGRAFCLYLDLVEVWKCVDGVHHVIYYSLVL